LRTLAGSWRDLKGGSDAQVALERVCERQPQLLSHFVEHPQLVEELAQMPERLALLCLLHLGLMRAHAVSSLQRLMVRVVDNVRRHFRMAENARFRLAEFNDDLEALTSGRATGVPHMIHVWRTHSTVRAEVQRLFTRGLIRAGTSVGPAHLAELDHLAAARAEDVVRRFAKVLQERPDLPADGAVLTKLLSESGRTC
jgi:hypothetical protein